MVEASDRKSKLFIQDDGTEEEDILKSRSNSCSVGSSKETLAAKLFRIVKKELDAVNS